MNEDSEELYGIIRRAVTKAAAVGISESDLRPDKHLYYTYGIDSMSIQVLILELEKELEIQIPEDHYDTNYFSTIGSIYTYLLMGLYNK
ncbi:MAG: hypothetical protein H7A25_06725 [Leptospiraceae bacterium]|nr:hypothetical protein [Leptospiraceae bacterium]MCP5499580.1 hypothetical protein [Leptospiraceae bacterium]